MTELVFSHVYKCTMLATSIYDQIQSYPKLPKSINVGIGSASPKFETWTVQTLSSSEKKIQGMQGNINVIQRCVGKTSGTLEKS